MRVLTFTEAAREIGCLPRDISDAVYARLLDERRLVQIGIRRAIPPDYLDDVREVLAQRGKIRQELVAR